MNPEPMLGPIQPEHARDGWQLRGDGQRWHLIKDYGRHLGVISATTSTTCAWQITTRAGDLLREASSGNDVARARAAADEWAAEHSPDP
jgi:hypothetical protein